MQLDSLEQMIKDYERRTGERISLEGFYFDENNNYKDKYNYYFKWFPNVGFLFWSINEHEGERYFTIWQTYGDMKVIGKYIVEVMKLNDLDVIVTATHRSVRGFIKKWNMERVPTMDYSYNGFDYKVLKTVRKHLEATL